MESYRNVAAIVICLTIIQAALGALSMIGPLSLASYGASVLDIGLVATAYSGGFLVAVRFAPGEVGRIGHIRSICAFAAVAAVAASGLGWSENIIWWAAAHALLGASAAGLFAAGESWIASSAAPERRGSVLSFYFILTRVGFLAGPFLGSSLPAGDTRGFLLVVMLLAAALIPVAATRRGAPQISGIKPISMRAVWATAPAALLAALVAGLINGAVRQLYPVFAADISPDDAAGFAAAFNGALYIGAILLQWPAGFASDKVDRRLAIAVLGGVAAVTSLGLALFAAVLPGAGILTLAFLWGGTSMSIYGIAVAHASDRADIREIPGLMSTILLIWAAGSMLGPLLGGAAMQVTGASGLFYICTLILSGLVIAMILRRRLEAPVAAADKSEFSVTPPTSAETAEINPMADD